MKFDWKKLHVDDAGVEFGRRVDALHKLLQAEYAERVQAPMRAARRNDDARDMAYSQSASDDLTVPRALPQITERKAPNIPATVLRQLLPGGQTNGMLEAAGEIVGPAIDLWGSKKPLTEKLGRTAAELAQWAPSTAVQTAVLGGMPMEAQAASGASALPFLKYIARYFPEMLASAKKVMRHTIETGNEAAAVGVKKDPTARMLPVGDGIVEGDPLSVRLPTDMWRQVADAPNSFFLHTHPNANSLPSSPINNAAQNPLGGDTEAFKYGPRGKLLRPGKVDNLIVSPVVREYSVPGYMGGSGENWTHMRMGEYPDKEQLSQIARRLSEDYEDTSLLDGWNSQVRYPEDVLSSIIERAPEFLVMKRFADTGRGDFTYNLGKAAFSPGEREPVSPMLDALYQNVLKRGWLNNYAQGGAVSKAGGGIVKKLLSRMPEYVEGIAPRAAPQGALSVVKNKGGNWLGGSVEDALGSLKQYGHVGDLVDGGPTTSGVMNQWIEGPLTKYVKTRMATPEDEVRKLAEQGVLHYAPEVVSYDSLAKATRLAHRSGYPRTVLATNPQARLWEHNTDVSIGATNKHTAYGEPVYKVVNQLDLDTLGFPHLVDELSNALNPESGLPRHLLLTPEAVQNMSMEKAVRRVADINAWRAEQMAKARLESMAGRPVIREYTENNPKGLRWVQLNREGDFAAESDAMGHSVRRYEPPERGGHSGYGFGGWPAIQRDKVRVFSLQDAEGEPHVTVEIGRGLGLGTRYDSATHYVQDHKKWDDWMTSIGGYEGFKKFIKSRDPSFDFRKNNGTSMDILMKVAPDVADEVGAVELPWYISQIKGKQNRAPNEEYLPFVQDFVRNSPVGKGWADVGDAQNAGLRRFTDAFSSAELRKLQEAGAELPEHGWLSGEELQNLHNLITPEGARLKYDASGRIVGSEDPRHGSAFASGGLVTKSSLDRLYAVLQ